MANDSNNYMFWCCGVISLDGNNRGNGNTGNSTTWYRVTTSAGGNPFLTNIIACRGAGDALMALDASGNIWTWGNNTYLGNNTAAANRSRATLMTLPTGVTAGQIKMIGMTTDEGLMSYYVLAKNGNLYALGENSDKQLGDWSTTDRLTWVQPRYTSAAGPVMNNIKWISPKEHDRRYGSINVLRNDSVLYAWGEDDGSMIGGGDAGDRDPFIPNGFIANAGGLALAVESGGHTTLIVAPCRNNYGYVGHRVRGSMGNGSTTDTNESQYTFATAPVQLCGAPGLPQITVSSPPYLGTGGFYCAFSSVELIFSPPNGNIAISGPATLSGNILTFGGPGTANVTLTYTLPPTVCGGTPPSTSINFITEDCPPDAVNDNGGTLVEDSPGGVVNIVTNDTDPLGTNPTAPVNGPGQFTYDLNPSSPGLQTTATNAQGTWTLNTTTGQVTFVPLPNFNGAASLTYQLCSPVTGLCDNAQILFTVTPVNDPPVAVNDLATTNEDTPVVLPGIHLNDTDIDGVIQVGSIDLNTSSPGQQTTITNAQGTWTVNLGTGNVTYTPAANFNGTATLPYSVCDNGTPLPAQCATANLIVTVVPVNDQPVANNDNATTPEDTPVIINVLSNDSDLDGSLVPASVAIGTPPANGTVSINAITGAITYTPNANWNGTDSFTYQVCDNGTPLPAQCASATVTVTVTPVNDPPVANDDNGGTIAEDSPGATVSILPNDTDADGNPTAPTNVLGGFTVDLNPSVAGIQTSITNAQGSWTYNAATGIVTYVPALNFNGAASIPYELCDPTALCDQAVISFTVAPVNDPPVANDDNVSTPEDSPVVINVLSNDTDLDGSLVPSSVAIGTPPANGTVSVNPVTGEITYTPNANWNGTDSFTYQVCDNGTPLPALCDVATVNVTVTPVNDPPVANDDNGGTIAEDSPGATVSILPNDTDADGNPTAPTNVLGGFTVDLNPSLAGIQTSISNAQGTWTYNAATGIVTYVPALNFNGAASIPYELCDPTALCDQATISFTVAPVNDPPVANDDNVSTPEDSPVVINVLSNDTDLDGSLVPSSVAIGTSPANGTVSVNPVTGEIAYTPNANWNGTDSFTYQVCDNGTPLPALCDVATVTVTVTPVNDPPVANDDNGGTIAEDSPGATVSILPNDTDADGNPTAPTNVPGGFTVDLDPSTAGIQTSITNAQGTWTYNAATGIVTYVPALNFNGAASIPYELCDPTALCDQAIISFTVAPVNDGPIANGDNATTSEDTPVVSNVPSNDTDVDGNLVPNTVAVSTPPANGTVSVNPVTGQITYTPNANWSGTDTFIYQICDDGTPLPSLCDTALVSVTVTPVNDGPVAIDDNATTGEDTPVVINVPANDTDVDGNLDLTSVGIVTGPSNGTTGIDPVTGEITYTPNANWNGTDLFTYSICDTGMPVICDIATVTVTVVPVNDAPEISDTTTTTPEDTPVTICIPITDPDLGNSFTAGLCDAPDNGTVSGPTVFNGELCITYIPNTNFNGIDSLCVTVCDNFGACDDATIVITVTPVNDPPVANNDFASTPEDVAVTIPVLDNDSDVDGNLVPATVAIVTPPSNGTISIDPLTGDITYTPNTNYNGTDSFSYIVCDDGTPLPSLCDTAVVTVSVAGINNPPVANADASTTNEDTPVTINVLNNDTDIDGNLVPNSVAIVTPPSNGSVFVNPLTGQVTYTPALNFNGTDSFIYLVCDDGTPLPSLCDTAVVTVTVLPVNDAPVAVNDFATTPEETPVVINVPANDTDVDGNLDLTSVTILSGPSNGSVSVDPATGAVTYTPALNFNGTDIFTYSICDTGLPVYCDTATVTVNVTPLNDTPEISDTTGTTPEDTPVTICIPITDPDSGNFFTAGICGSPSHGTIVGPSVFNGELCITYTPATNYNGPDSLCVTVCDNFGACDSAVIVIVVTPVNDPPVAVNDNYTTPEDTQLNGNVGTNDNLTDGPGADYTLVSNVSNGTLVLNPDGTFTYTPAQDYNGPDSFTYSLCDTDLPSLCDTAVVTINVTPLNDAPEIPDSTVTTPEDTPITVCLPITDPDSGNFFTAGLCGSPSQGTIIGPTVFNGELCITYTPVTNYSGLDSLCVTVCDNFGACDSAVIVINVTPVNDPPVAVNDNYTTPEDTQLNGNVGTNDNLTDGPGSDYTLVSNVSNGTLVLNSDGTFTYTPAQDYNGPDSFTYSLCDTDLPSLCDTAIVTINVTPLNDAPEIPDSTVTTPEDTPITVCLPITDPDSGNFFTAGLCGSPSQGTIVGPTVFNGELCITYTPVTNYSGLDSLCVTVCDNFGACDSAVIVINVTPVNDPPVAVNDNYTTPEDTQLNGNVGTNDNLTDGPGADYTLVSNVSNGTLVLNPDGTFTYTPAQDYNGPDSFTYSLCDTDLPSLCDTAVVTINVTPLNDAPEIPDSTVTTPEDTPITVCLPITDPDSGNFFTAGLCGSPLNGTVSGPTVFNGNVCITYTPTSNYNGLDSLCVTVCDNFGACDSATIVINVTPANDPPVAVDDTATTDQSNPVVINVPSNDFDPDGQIDSTTVTIITAPTQGSVTVDPVTGAITYTPGPTACGTDTFVYSICDDGSPVLCDQATVTVTITDSQSPVVVNCPADITIGNAADACGANVSWVVPTATDNCGGFVSSFSNYSPGAFFPIGTTAVTYTFTDASGNDTTCTFNVTVNDTQSPIIIGCPIDITADNFPSSCGTRVNWIVPTALDNCSGVTLTSTHFSGQNFPVGITTVTYTATDAAGNITQCSFDITVVDSEAPVIAGCPTNITVGTTAGSCEGVATWTLPVATDNCGIFSFTSTHNSGDVFPIGVTTVTYTAIDSAANVTVCTFTVTVEDTEAPVVSGCPSDITVNVAQGLCSNSVTWTAPSASDNCGAVTVSSTHSPGQSFPVGTTPVTYTFTDAAGNITQCTFNVTVVDNEPPAIVACPIDITVNNFPSSCGTRVNWVLPTALDNCGTVSMTSTHNSGENFPVGVTTVTYTATDAAGNVTICEFDITVVDSESPVITGCPSDITVNTTPGNCDGIANWTVPVATDNCGIFSFTSTHSPGDVFPIGVTTVTYTAVDTAGNTTICEFDVIVVDIELPVFTSCPSDITTDATVGICGASVTWPVPSVSDNCASPVVTSTHNPGDVFPVGTTTVTYIVTDASGNTDTCSFDVTVIDVIAPEFTNCPSDITVNNLFNTCSQQVYWSALTATDNCGSAGLTITSSHSPGFVFPVGTTLVTSYVTDAAGNSDTCTFNVTVLDTQVPTIEGCPIDVTVSNSPGLCGANYTWIQPTAFDNCPGVVVTSTHNSGSFFPLGTTTVTFTATDAAGLTATCSFVVTVEDTEAPVIVGCPADTVLPVDAASCSAVYSWIAPTATDNCAMQSISSTHNPGDSFPVGTTTVVYTAVDSAGNISECSFTVTVLESEAPVLVNCPADITVSNDAGICGAAVTWTPPTASDNCGSGFTLTSTHNPGFTFPVGTTVVTYTVTDQSGNSSSCSFNVTVTDEEAPLIANCPSDITAGNDFNTCGAAVSWPLPLITDNCPGVNFTVSHLPGSTFPLGTTQVTYVAFDAAGNTDTCTFNVTVTDTQAPQIVSCLADITVNNQAGLCSAPVSWTLPSALDNCPGVTLTSSHNSGDIFPVGVTVVTYTATDSAGNTATCVFNVTVVDSQAPVIAGCPSNISVNTDPGQCTATVNWAVPTVSDNCGISTFTSNFNSGDVFPVGTTTVTYTAVDSAGNTATCTFNVTVTENEVPVINGCPANINVTNDAGICGASVTWVVPVASDNCGVLSFTSTHNSGDIFPVGTTTVTYTATDASGNTAVCSFTVTVTDPEAPVISGCPSDITVNNDLNMCGASVTWIVPVASDNCPGVTMTASHLPGTVFPVGTTTVTYVATDAGGNTDTCSFTITVNDVQFPVISVCPSNITTPTAPGLCEAVVLWNIPSVFDNCPGATLVSSHNSGDIFPVGSTTVTYTATDAAGNVATCNFVVTVTETEFPVIIGCPSDITVSTDPGVCEAVVSWNTPSATDNCILVSFTSNFVPGDVFPVGTTTVTYTAVDAVGNTTECSFDVTVVDNVAPVITGCPGNITANNDAGICGASVTWVAPTASDNCAGGLVFTASHNPGDVFPVGTTTVTYTATDASGNTAVCSFNVAVSDTEVPVLTNCPTDITVSNAFNTCAAPVSWTAPVVTDNCRAVTVTASHLPGTSFPVGTTTVTYIATDASGNVDSCSFNITVQDTQFPTISGCPIDITVPAAAGTCSEVVSWIAPSAFDNCPGVTLTSSHAPGSTFPVGNTLVTYTATDAAGNVTTCTFNIFVTETQAPVIADCPSDISVSNDAGICGASVTWTVPTATDNCTLVSFVSTHNPGDIFPVGTTTVTYTATDAAGNISICTFNVTVIDTEAPVLTACPSNITVSNDAGICGAAVTWTAPTASDNCGVVSLSSTFNSGHVFPVGTTTVVYTAVDAAGNSVSCSFTVTVNDTQAPATANCPTDITVNAAFNTCGAPVLWTPPVFTDNCGVTSVTGTHLPGTTFPVGTTTVTYTALDAAGNSTICSFNITVLDVQAPQIVACPIDVTLSNNEGLCGATHSWILPSALDNCPGVTITSTHAPGTFFPVGATTVTYTATDVSGNTATCTFVVTVVDAEAPVIANGSSDISISNDQGLCSAVANWSAPTASDNCAVTSFTSTHNPGDVFPVGVTPVTYTATDAAGNVTIHSFTVTVVDDELPVVSACPSDITVSNDQGDCSAAVTWTAPTATDNCGNVVVSASHNPGDVFPVGITAVTYTFTDDAGNVSVCGFNVEVNDDEAPVALACPADINSCEELIIWTPPTFTDNCTNNMTVTSNFSPGSNFPVGSTTVVYTATDAAGNSTTCSFVVTRSAITIVPVFTNVTCNGANDGTATVIVNDAIAPLTFDWGSAGSDSLLTNLAPGDYTVTVTDAIGCSATATVTITEPEVLNLELVKIIPGKCGLGDGSAEVIALGGTEPYTYIWSNQQSGPVISFVEAGVYGVTVVDANGCSDTLSVNINCNFAEIPQLVTPNGDGHNDVWFIPGINAYPEARVELYNRWGAKIFDASPYQNNWDGYSSGIATIGKDRLPAGTYFYVIQLTKDSDVLTGYIELQY